jgi:hypothetical protein
LHHLECNHNGGKFTYYLANIGEKGVAILKIVTPIAELSHPFSGKRCIFATKIQSQTK